MKLAGDQRKYCILFDDEVRRMIFTFSLGLGEDGQVGVGYAAAYDGISSAYSLHSRKIQLFH